MEVKVVLLDDNPQDRFLTKRALAMEFPDLHLIEPRDQAEFHALLPRLTADIIITDYQLRWTDGLKVLSTVRDAGHDLPVIMCTLTGSEEVAASGLREGLADYIVKSATHYGRLAQSARMAIQQAEIARRDRESRARERESLRVAEEALRAKEEFLATLSHELRTPLNAICGWVQLMKSFPDPHRQEKGITAIERNATALRRLIDDLVDVSRMVTGKFALDIRPTDARLVVEAAMDSVRPSAQEKRVALEMATPVMLEPILGDPDRLQQVVWNLLSNAVKFTPAGGRVDVTLRMVDAMVEITVADSGPGIREDFLPRVFEPFSQQDSSTTKGHAGLGLGLAIVRHLVGLHGGTVSVDSAEGHGATFTVLFPTVDAAVTPDDAAPRGGGKRLEGVVALLVDDDPDGLEVMERLLEDEGAVVTAVRSAPEAYQRLSCERPHVLVCDIAMPHEDGLTLIRRIRADRSSQIASVPAVAVTAYASDTDRLRALAAGYQFHVPKPVRRDELLAAIGFLTNPKGQATS